MNNHSNINYPSIKLPIDYIKNFRKDVTNNSYLILNNESYRNEWNIICACMDRIEDTARYLNSKILGEKHDYGCAFDLMEFLSHSASMLDCIETIAETIKANCTIEPSDIIFKSKVITDQKKLNERLAKVQKNKPYKNEDDLYFEYIRSIGIVHPNSTDHHPYFQQFEKEVSPFLIWNRFVGLTDGDISLHIYDFNGKESFHSLKLELSEIYEFIVSRYNRIQALNTAFNSQINALKIELKNQQLLNRRAFNDYSSFLSYLRVEAHKRSEFIEYCIDETAKMIGLNNMPNAIKKQYLRYCNALKYAIDDLRGILQTSILNDDFNEDILVQELHLPDILPEDEVEGITYYYEKTGKLYDESRYGKDDIDWARIQAKNLYEIVKNYAPVGSNILDNLDNLQLLAVLNTALYFYSLEHDTFINKRIPKSNKYR